MSGNLMVNGYTAKGDYFDLEVFQRKQLLLHFFFLFAFRFIKRQLSKKRICSIWSKFISLRLDPFFGEFCRPRKLTVGHDRCVPLIKWRKTWQYTIAP